MTWELALDEIAARIVDIGRRHGPDSVAIYVGTPASHGHSTLFFLGPFLLALGTRNLFTANSADALPRLLASRLVFGSAGLLPVPDVERTDYLLMLGANPVISGGSIMTAPGFGRHLRALVARGGRSVVLDPRRSETARCADEHVFLRPGTDALVLLGILHSLFAGGPDRPGVMESRLSGLRRVRAVAARFSPERVAAATGVSAATMRRLTLEMARSPSAVCYGRMGTSTQAFGTTASWLMDVLNAVTGNLDRPGGAMFTRPAVDLAGLMDRLGLGGSLGDVHTRLRGLPSFNRELPLAALAEEMDTPGHGQIRALVTLAGNPVLSGPNGPRLERALERLELMVSIDPYLNETSRHAHYLLPPAIGLECAEYPLIAYSTAIRNVARFSPMVIPAPPNVRPDWEILWGLTSRLAQRRGRLPSAVARVITAAGLALGPEALLRLALRLGPHGGPRPGGRPVSLSRLLENPHGLDLGPLEPQLEARLGKRKVELAPGILIEDLTRLETTFLGPVTMAAPLGDTSGSAEAGHPVRLRPAPGKDEPATRTSEPAGRPSEAVGRPSEPAGTLLLIGRRELRGMNTWMHNLETLARGEARCCLDMHPDDARSRGLGEGQHVRVTSCVGCIQVPLRITDTIMPGVVCLPFGWGHNRPGTRQEVASRHGGESINDLTDELRVDAVSGACDFNGVPVTVLPVPPVTG